MAKTVYRMSPIGEEARHRLENQGFYMPDAPDEEPALPTDVSDLDSPTLMALFSLFTGWCDYAAAQVGLAVVMEREAERLLEKAEAEAWRDIGKGASVTASKALVVLSDDVQDARYHLDECYAYRRLVSDLAARYERDAAVLSRELTRRTSENGPKQSRRERWGNA
jgi:hypothetical protein